MDEFITFTVPVGTENATDLEKQILEQWEKSGICNDFIFGKVMQNEELLEELIHIILPDLKFSKFTFVMQKPVEIGPDIHGVRFDIFVTLENGDTIIIEMQATDRGNLPKRLRYYNSIADMQLLEKSLDYNKLRDSYVIMICPFDYYGAGRHVYTFTNRCNENTDIKMGDGTCKIVLNASGTMDDVSGPLKEFLDYVAGKPVQNDFIKKLDAEIRKAKANKKWRLEFMTGMMRDIENREEGRQEGTLNTQKHIISNMLAKGMSIDEISDLCGYPVEQVTAIIEDSRE